MIKKRKLIDVCITICLVFALCLPCYAIDSELTRRTLKGMRGVHIIVEDLQPTIKDYGQKVSFTNIQFERETETRLRAAGIEVFHRDQWLKTLGRPLLYININTHDDKFRIAYDVRVELKQIISLEANPEIKTLAPTWSINMTGIASIERLDIIRDALNAMVDRFIKAYWLANEEAVKSKK